MYRQVSNIRRTESQNFNVSRFSVENEDVVGAAPTGDAPTTSEWSPSVLPTKVWLILEIWRFEHIYWPPKRFSTQKFNPVLQSSDSHLNAGGDMHVIL